MRDSLNDNLAKIIPIFNIKDVCDPVNHWETESPEITMFSMSEREQWWQRPAAKFLLSHFLKNPKHFPHFTHLLSLDHLTRKSGGFRHYQTSQNLKNKKTTSLDNLFQFEHSNMIFIDFLVVSCPWGTAKFRLPACALRAGGRRTDAWQLQIFWRCCFPWEDGSWKQWSWKFMFSGDFQFGSMHSELFIYDFALWFFTCSSHHHMDLAGRQLLPFQSHLAPAECQPNNLQYNISTARGGGGSFQR